MIVKDTTPPLQPSLNPPKDRDSTFSGMAEKKSIVKVYDEADKSLIVSGEAGIDGHYALTIPEAKKPLKPYKEYYVTATDSAGNVSENSTIQLVADTTPPTADPVKQVLTLGDPLPELSTLVTAIADNAGAENVLLEQTKSPDLSKVGYTTAESTLIDAAKNKTVIIVPIVVKDAQTALDENNLLDARDFTIETVYYPETEEEQKRFLLESGQVSAWDIINGKNVVEQVTIDKTNLVKKPGSYEITYHVGKLKKEITVTLTKGDITFDHIPSSMSFGTQTIRSNKQTIRPENSINVSIIDTRFVANDWRLFTQLNQPLQTNNGELMSGGILFHKKDENGDWVKETIDEKVPTEVFSKTKATFGKTTVNFLDDKEIVLSILPGSVYSNKEYNTTIIWTLENAP
nr:Ig-like domain-containing protein [Enterococcus sp. DIV0212c]